MRERHSYAILKVMGLDECIASSPEEYTQIVYKLVRDKEFRNSVIHKIRSRCHLIFDDEQCIVNLAQFYSRVVGQH